jgi:beta-galactosidase
MIFYTSAKWARRLAFILLSILSPFTTKFFAQPVAKQFSTAGFYELENSGRKVYNFNQGWRFHKGDVSNAEKPGFADKSWEIVCLPHSVELVPAEASGCVNYQGPAWYRKHFTLDNEFNGKKVFLYFEAIMGKSKVFVNGKLVTEHFGGYLPVILDLTQAEVKPGEDILIAVWTDNSDDKAYPPGKPQDALDFTYFGGIYRDAWLVATSAIHITDPNFVNKIAGGGVFVHYEDLSEQKAVVVIESDLINESSAKQDVKLETVLVDNENKVVGKTSGKLTMEASSEKNFQQRILIENPHLWHPDNPYLYRLESRLVNGKGQALDGFYSKIGIRKIEFRGKDGFYLNNKPFGDKLIGANRHQDYAYVGNALPNTGQWHDAKKLRDAGLRIIRSAHYPQDPAFMDACDELGLFVIVATPGWQFWNKDSIFAARIYSDISNMVRRDRNHPSVIMWEPILNETRFPADFSKKTYELVHKEYPYQGCFAACDDRSAGSQLYDVIYAHPLNKGQHGAEKGYEKIDKCVFTREWGDNVDNWNSHNSNSRVSRSWGEGPQLIQAIHYANPTYDDATSYNSLYLTPAQHVGGCLWHPFDHQRGYHPDPFWGGILDAFRQPKYSYYMFESQRDPSIKHPTAESGPMIYIANELTPFSSKDVVVFTNCEAVRLIIGKDTLVQNVEKQRGMPHPPVIFKQTKAVSETGKGAAKVMAEGLINQKVVVTTLRKPARRQSKIALKIDNDGLPLVADGSDFVPVIATITDDEGNVKCLTKDVVKFTVEGEGQVIGDETIGANPRVVEWGSAPMLLKSTLKAGKIKVTATITPEGLTTAKAATLELESVAPAQKMVYTEVLQIIKTETSGISGEQKSLEQLKQELEKTKEELRQLKLKEVERDQDAFGEGKKK